MCKGLSKYQIKLILFIEDHNGIDLRQAFFLKEGFDNYHEFDDFREFESKWIGVKDRQNWTSVYRSLHSLQKRGLIEKGYNKYEWIIKKR